MWKVENGPYKENENATSQLSNKLKFFPTATNPHKCLQFDHISKGLADKRHVQMKTK